MKMKNYGHKKTVGKVNMLSILCCFLAVLLAMTPLQADAATDSESKVVKVGWYQDENFQIGASDDEEKGGYCYQYLQEISHYNGWIYEYVYGDREDLLEQLKAGEIDIMAGIAYSPENAVYLSFPTYEMGNDVYSLYQHDSNKVMDATDSSSFKGRKIGTLTNDRMTYFLEQWAEENNVDPELVYYTDSAERDADFEAGLLDGLVANDNTVFAGTDYALVTSVGSEAYYLAVTMKRPDLVRDLNNALAMMQQTDPYFLQNLQYTWFGSNLSNSSLTDMEKTWLDSHDTLQVGYLEDYMPYSGTDADGRATGLVTNVITASLEALDIDGRLKVVYQGYDSYDEMVEDLREGNLDAAFPVGGGEWNLDNSNIMATKAVVTAGMDLVYKTMQEPDADVSFAVNTNSKLMIYFIRRYYPNATLITYDSIEECFDAVKNGAADYTVINGLRVNLVRDNRKYNELSVIQLQETDDRCIGVKHGNSALLLILNRGLKLIGSDYGVNASYNYIAQDNANVTWTDFFSDHLTEVFAISVAITLLIIVLLTIYVSSIRKAKGAAETQLTKNRELTAQLERKNVELQEANLAKSRFLFNMSHDIRTPMNAIIGFTELIKLHREERTRVDDYLEKIEASSRFLLSLINNVLEMARIESGKMVLEETQTDIAKLTDEMAVMFTDQMKKKNIRFETQIDVQHTCLLCDQPKMREIYLNILSNACKFTSAGGNVWMQLKELPSAKEGYALMELKISDTGIGMTKEYLAHIFEEFSRAQTTTESRQEGTGLGMPIVKRLVDLMEGRIQVESEPGRGTTFTVTFYGRIQEPRPIENAETESVRSHDFSGRRILLAEDNDLNAEIAEEILREAGFETERAKDGAVCVKMLQAAGDGYYDLILMDVQMPQMNGYEATKCIRAMKETGKRQIPIIAMTANAFEEDKKNAYDAGMNGHLAKPIDIPTMMRMLGNILEEE